MADEKKVTVLKEVHQFTGQARYDRYHLITCRDAKGGVHVLGIVQEKAGSVRYDTYQLAESTIRLELQDGGPSRPPILEVYREGVMIFRMQLGGRRPRPLTIQGSIKVIPCQWGHITPQKAWGENVQVEKVSPPDGVVYGDTSTLPF